MSAGNNENVNDDNIGFKLQTLAEMGVEAEEEIRRIHAGETRWGRWSYEPSIFVLNHEDGYQVDLLRLDSERDHLHAIHHLAAKTGRFDAADLGWFVRALHDIGGADPVHEGAVALWRVLPGRELRFPLPDPMTPTQLDKRSGVYVIRAGSLVKIGKAVDVASRRDSLQTGSAERLDVLAVLTPNSNKEGEWHQRFAHLRTTGKWFHLGEQIAVFIRDARDHEAQIEAWR